MLLPTNDPAFREAGIILPGPNDNNEEERIVKQKNN